MSNKGMKYIFVLNDYNSNTGNEKAGENCKKPDKSAHYPVILCTLTSSYFHASIQKESWGVPKLPENW